jgi:hypothetical protein
MFATYEEVQTWFSILARGERCRYSLLYFTSDQNYIYRYTYIPESNSSLRSSLNHHHHVRRGVCFLMNFMSHWHKPKAIYNMNPKDFSAHTLHFTHLMDPLLINLQLLLFNLILQDPLHTQIPSSLSLSVAGWIALWLNHSEVENQSSKKPSTYLPGSSSCLFSYLPIYLPPYLPTYL